MPSASPVYSFLGELQEATSLVAPTYYSSINNNVYMDSSSSPSKANMFCFDFINGNNVDGRTSSIGCNDSSSINSTQTYNPFKCLSVMAGQDLINNFTHTSLFSPNFSNPGRNGSNERRNKINNQIFTNTDFQNGRSTYSSVSSTPSFTSSSSPALSSSSSHFLFPSTHGSNSERSFNDGSSYENFSPARENKSPDLLQLGVTAKQVSSQERCYEIYNLQAHCKKEKEHFPCQLDTAMAQEESDLKLKWTLQHPESWSSSQVLDWVFYVAQEIGLNMQEFRGENFRAFTGAELCRMSEDDFINLEPKFGRVMHGMFRNLLLGASTQKPVEADDVFSCLQVMTYPQAECARFPIKQEWPLSSASTSLVSDKQKNYCYSTTDIVPVIKQEPYSSACNRDFDLTSYDFDLNDAPCVIPTQNQAPYNHDYSPYPAQNPRIIPTQTMVTCSGASTPSQHNRRRPGRPRVNKTLVCDSRVNSFKKVKNQHLWEFIYETLMNPMYNPQFLRWENQRDGIFRFVQSESVAQLWGRHRNNENMTYEKLSRAMRHYYRRGILERIEGRRLVYKFSLKALEVVRGREISI